MAKIYTKTGDKGETSLVGGQRVSKTHAQIEAYGTVDELNSVLGMCRAALQKDSKFQKVNGDLTCIQHWLFDLGSLLAAHEDDRTKYSLRPITKDHVTWLEKRIDEATAQLKPLKNFILPAGTEGAAALHLARTVSRRAERMMLLAMEAGVILPSEAVPFINRLSDYFFVMSRYVNHLAGISDVEWAETLPK